MLLCPFDRLACWLRSEIIAFGGSVAIGNLSYYFDTSHHCVLCCGSINEDMCQI